MTLTLISRNRAALLAAVCILTFLFVGCESYERFLLLNRTNIEQDFRYADGLGAEKNHGLVRLYFDRHGDYYPDELVFIDTTEFLEAYATLFQLYLNHPARFKASFDRYNIALPTEEFRKLNQQDSLTWQRFQDSIVATNARAIESEMLSHNCEDVTFLSIGFDNYFRGNNNLNTLVKLAKIRNRIGDYLDTSYNKHNTCFVEIHWDGTATNVRAKKTLNFSFASQTTYYVGMELRALLNKMDADIHVRMISHSTSANILTTVMFNQRSKLSNHDDDLAKELTKMEANPRYANPKQHITALLLAPAVPGQTTFMDFRERTDSTTLDNYNVIIGYNETDPALQKVFDVRFLRGIDKFIKCLTDGKRGLSTNFSSTSLGTNIKNEVDKTYYLMDTLQCAHLFTIFDFTDYHLDSADNIPITLPLDIHEVTTYMQSSKYDSILMNLYDFQPEGTPGDTIHDPLVKLRHKRDMAEFFFEELQVVSTPSTVSGTGVTNWAFYPDTARYKKSFILNADINTPIALGGRGWHGKRGFVSCIHLTPQFKIRILAEDHAQSDKSLPVRTPSYLPRVTYYGSPRCWMEKRPQMIQYFGLMAFHHSDGQDGHEFIDSLNILPGYAIGETNKYNGNFGENAVFEFMYGGIWYSNDAVINKSLKKEVHKDNKTHLNKVSNRSYRQLYWKVGFEWHPRGALTNKEFDSVDVYSRHRVNYEFGFIANRYFQTQLWHSILHRWEDEGDEVPKELFRVLLNGNILLGKLMSGPLHDLKPAPLPRRLNLWATFHIRIPGTRMASGFAQVGYWGSDNYNMYFDQQIIEIRWGLSWGFYRYGFNSGKKPTLR